MERELSEKKVRKKERVRESTESDLIELVREHKRGHPSKP